MEKREIRKDRKREWEGTAMTLKKLSCILDLQEFKKSSFSLPLDYEICKDEERQVFFLLIQNFRAGRKLRDKEFEAPKWTKRLTRFVQ